MRDLAEIGVTDVWFGHNHGRGGPFYHPTEVDSLQVHGSMRGRDFLEELLVAAGENNVRVWLSWTPPSSSSRRIDRPGWNDGLYALEDYTLASPELRRVFCELIDEVASKYLPRHPHLAGICLHEIHAGLDPMDRPLDLERFRAYCWETFGEDYTEDAMPGLDAEEVWSRRYLLYRQHVTTEFTRVLAECARAHGLKTFFFHYPAETSAGWRIGADVLELEKIVDGMWEVSFALENCKHYYSVRGAVLDFGPSYRNNHLSLYFASAFHGYPLSFFDFSGPLYVEEKRAAHPPGSPWRQQYGDPYTGHGGKTEREVELFFGRERMGAWLRLMARWQGGETPAQIAAAINPTPYLMLRPRDHSRFFVDNTAKLMEALTVWADIDGMVSGSLAMTENLRRYELILIPEEQGTGLSRQVYEQYRTFVEEGGTLLVVNTPITTAERDLTDEQDHTAALCGVHFRAGGAAPLVMSVAGEAALRLPAPGKTWRYGYLENSSAEILVRNAETDAPLVTRRRLGKGNVIFSALGFQPGLEDFYVSLAQLAVQPRFWLEGPGGMRILEAVQKDNQLCISLWGQGERLLKIDARRAGLTGERWQARDIITGQVFAEALPADAWLTEGVPVHIAYEDQPMVVVVGPPESMPEYPGIYESAEVFRGLRERRPVAENPQVPILVPPGSGARVGVYHSGLGADEMMAIAGEKDLRVFSLPRLDAEAMGYADVIIIPQVAGHVEFFNQAQTPVRAFVAGGGGGVADT